MKNLDFIVDKIVSLSKTLQIQLAKEKADLTYEYFEIANSVGVSKPNLIQLYKLEKIPTDVLAISQEIKKILGMRTSYTLGIALGYQVFILKDQITPSTIAHEFRHVYQYEQFGCITTFLKAYLLEVIKYGYLLSPMEQDALKYQLIFEQ